MPTNISGPRVGAFKESNTAPQGRATKGHKIKMGPAVSGGASASRVANSSFPNAKSHKGRGKV
jgi:hypothetical protein